MDPLPPPLAFFLHVFFLHVFSGWVNRQQQAVIEYLLEENRVLRAAHGPRRLRLTDDQRRRLAVKGKVLGRRRLTDVAGIVTPDTILRWYRRLVANKYDGSKTRLLSLLKTSPAHFWRLGADSLPSARLRCRTDVWGQTSKCH